LGVIGERFPYLISATSGIGRGVLKISMMKSALHQHLSACACPHADRLAQRIFLTIIILKRLAYLLSKTDKGRLIKETDLIGNLRKTIDANANRGKSGENRGGNRGDASRI